MPCCYRVDTCRSLIVITIEGCVTVSEALDVQRRLLSDPAFDPRMRELCDFRGADVSELGSLDVKLVAEVSPRHTGRGKRAMVVDPGLQFGLARMFQAYASMNNQPTEVFTDLAEALAWLGIDDVLESPPAPAPAARSISRAGRSAP